jgi:RHS repeat-associated protein
MNKTKPVFMQLKYLLLFASLQLAILKATAQNFPILTQTSVPGTITTQLHPLPSEVTVGPGQKNTVTNYTPIVPIADTGSINSGTPSSTARQQVAYLDGEGKAYQSIVKDVAVISGVHKNLVKVSDNLAQTAHYDYLPYSSNNADFNPTAFQDQKSYYTAAFPNEAMYTSFSKTMYTSTANTRAIATFAPGKTGQGLAIGSLRTAALNAANEVLIWHWDTGTLPVTAGYYSAGVLTLTESTNPDASGSNTSVAAPRSKVYTDKDGKVILKMLADSTYVLGSTNVITYMYTYYVYDVKGNLKCTITPKAYKYYLSTSSLTTTILNNLCFQYQYDAKGRPCGIKKPGEGDFTYIVYDRKDRPVMRQTPNEQAVHEWEVTFMDALGRQKVSSVYKDVQSTALDHNGWQNAIDTWPGTGTYSDLINYLVTPAMEPQYPVGNNPVSDAANNAFGASYIANNTIMSINYYDDYSKLDPSNTLFTECQNKLPLPSVTAAGQETPTQGRTYGMVTGSISRILRSPNANASRKVGDWRTSVNIYDDKGRSIASKTFVNDNMQTSHPIINSDWGVVQYDFANRVLVSGHALFNLNSQYNTLLPSHVEYTKYQYDENTGALVKSVHQVDGSAWKTLSTNTYDDMGRASRHTLGAGGEVQDMTYNIRGQLTGINGVYAETAQKGGVSKTFGESLKYDFGFSKSRYDGKLAGMVWRGSSASDMYAYGYDYTQNGALKTADFNHIESGAWKHITMDYSVSNLFYDKNGNIISMKQRGVKPGTGPVTMDSLAYTYEGGDISNHLSQVIEGPTASSDYGAGDFQGTAGDTYDANGNLRTNTGNKNIVGISYTRFNKPQTITFSNSSTIEYSYDALGNKVEELVIDKISGKRKRTDYIGNAVYENKYLTNSGDGTDADSLQYLLTSDGRTTFNFNTNLPNEEFFVKDHLGNVRSTINVSGYELKNYLATYELASANLEDLVFDNVEDIRDIRPGGEGDNTMAANLNGGDPNRIVGSSLLVHVMAGDKVGMNVSTLFNDYDAVNDEPVDAGTVLNSIITTLTGGVGGFEGSESHNTKIVESVFNPENYSSLDGLIQSATDVSKPKAYLNYALFDERMQLVGEMSGAFQATGNGDWALIGTSAPIEVPTNGYLAVYLSNTSKTDVYYDQLAISISHGNLLQENHYYPHGLPIFGLGSTTTDANYRENREKYQSNEYVTDQNLNWMSFGARQYDPQIGRFLSVDPLADQGGQDMYSPYAAMGNQPESCIDPNGLQSYLPEAAQSYGGESAGGLGSDLKWQFGKNGGGGGYGTLSGGGGNGPAPVFASNFTAFGVGGVALSMFWNMVPDMMKDQIMTDYQSYEAVQGYIARQTAINNKLYGGSAGTPGGFIGTYEQYQAYEKAQAAKARAVPIASQHVSNFDGFLGKVSWVLDDRVGMGRYDMDGNLSGIAPVGGAVPDFGAPGAGSIVNTVETVENFYVYGSTITQGGNYVRNIKALASLDGSAGNLPRLLNAFESEAQGQGASQIIINGINVVETRLMNPAALQRLGYSYEQTSENAFRITKQLQK